MRQRALSPIVGGALLIVITLLLATVFSVGVTDLADLSRSEKRVDGITAEATAADGAGGYRSELIWARDDAPGVTTSHVVNYTIAPGSDTSGNSLNSIVIEYPDGTANVEAVDERSEVLAVGIDEDRDGDLDVTATGDVECCPPDDGVKVSDDGNTLTIELSGNYDLEGGDALIVEYEAVENPATGSYAVTVGVNGDVTDSGTLEVMA